MLEKFFDQFLYDNFVEKYTKTIEDLYHEECEIEGMPVNLEILDTTGGYDFPAMRDLSIRTGDAFILVYSVDDEASFETVKKLRNEIINHKNDMCCPIVIVGNKTDVENRAIQSEIADSTVSIDWDHCHIESSAKDNINIHGIFKKQLMFV